jgi:hypothetical protein
MKNKYELNSNLIPLFSGTYETQWQPEEYDNNGNELYLEYNLSDLMKSIVDAYKSQELQINRDLKEVVPFLKKITFLKTFYSPREYNFSTDTIDFTLTVNKTKLKQTLNQLKDDQKFHEYLKDNFTSYDGFMSFTPNNYDELKDNIINEGNEEDQAIGALITYLAGEEILNDIEEMSYDYWQGNGYCGLDYEIIEE